MAEFNGMRVARPGGAPARFDRNPRRRSMLAKVHIAQKQLGLSDDDYRAVLLRVAGRVSAGDCTDAELVKVLDEFAAKGFSAQAKPGARKPGHATSRGAPADHPVARKARSLWIGLGSLGAIADASEPALETFARRQLGCERMQWANAALGYKLIEALKAIAERAGWAQSTAGVEVAAVPAVLSRRLVDALVAKLKDAGIVPAAWDARRVAWELAGMELALPFGEVEELHRLAAALGAKLRAGK